MGNSESTSRSAALTSRLLTQQDLDDALSALNAGTGESPAPLVEIGDQQLADKLVEMERLNRWQAEMLKAGNTRFHLKDYQIIDSLGQGGMGQVYKAEHSMMGRVVAIKVLPQSRSTKEAVASFQHEIRSLAKLDHPNLVRAYDAGHDGNVHFLVTEFVPGQNLRQLVRQGGQLAQRHAATIIAKAALGLEHAHRAGLIHRDVKPGNIMVTPEGNVKVLDLGLAGFLQEDVDYDDPRKGRIVGTADYLAPEVILRPDSASRASDIYSLGCSFYYAITSKVPFPGGSSGQKCKRHLNEIPLHPRRFNQDTTDELLNVLADMMEKDPDKRIQTATEVVELLAPWTDDLVTTDASQAEGLVPEVNFARAAPTILPNPKSSSSDTQEFPEMSPAETESPSQISQGTERVSQAVQETSSAILPPVADHAESPRPAPSLPPRTGVKPLRTGVKPLRTGVKPLRPGVKPPRRSPPAGTGMSPSLLIVLISLPILLMIVIAMIVLWIVVY